MGIPTHRKAVACAKGLLAFLREAANGMYNAVDVAVDVTRVELYGFSAGASVDELSERRSSQREAVLKHAEKIAGRADPFTQSKDDLVRQAMQDSANV